MAKGFFKRKMNKSAEYNSPDYWYTVLRNSVELRKKYSRISRWKDIEGYWNHDYSAGTPVFNLIYMFGRALIPTLMYKNPTIINTPRFPKNIPMAGIMDSIDAWLVQEMELESIMKKAILYAFLYNMAPIETGFDFPTQVDGSTPEERFKNAFLANMGILDSGGSGSNNRARRQNFPWLDLVYPRKILFEPTTRDMRTCRWFAKSLYTPTRLLKDDPFINTKNLKATHMDRELADSETKDLYERVTNIEEYTHFYEIHNKETGEMLIMQSDGQMLMENQPDPMQFDGLPLDCLIFNQNPLSIWGTPDSLYIEPMMLEGNEIRSLSIKQLRASLLKFVVNGDNMDDEEIEKVFTEDVVALRANNVPPNNQSLGNVISMVNPPPKLELDVKNNNLINDAQKILGFGNNQIGNYNSGRRTAKEASIVQWHNQMRTDERRWMVANTITGIMRKVNQAVMKYWTEPMLVRVLGVEGALYWVKAKPADVKAEMELKVDVESLVPPSKEGQKEDLLKLVQILAQSPDAQILPLLRRLMSKFPNVDAAEVFPVKNEETDTQGYAQAQKDQLNNPKQVRQNAVAQAEKLIQMGS